MNGGGITGEKEVSSHEVPRDYEEVIGNHLYCNDSHLYCKYGFFPDVKNLREKDVVFDRHWCLINHAVDWWGMNCIDALGSGNNGLLKKIYDSLKLDDVESYRSYISNQETWVVRDWRELNKKNGKKVGQEEAVQYYQETGDSQRYRLMFGLMWPERVYLNTDFNYAGKPEEEKWRDVFRDTLDFFYNAEVDTFKRVDMENKNLKYNRIPYLEFLLQNSRKDIINHKGDFYDRKVEVLENIFWPYTEKLKIIN